MATTRRAIPLEDLEELFSTAYDTTFGVSIKPVEWDPLSEVLVMDCEGTVSDLALLPGYEETLT